MYVACVMETNRGMFSTKVGASSDEGALVRAIAQVGTRRMDPVHTRVFAVVMSLRSDAGLPLSWRIRCTRSSSGRVCACICDRTIRPTAQEGTVEEPGLYGVDVRSTYSVCCELSG